MAGSWELRNRANVLTVILHTDLVSMAWALGFRNLQIPGGVMPVTGMPYDMARNVGCMKALEEGFSHVFFLDSDVVPPHDTVLRLLAHGKPIVSGVYCRRSPPHAIPVMLKGGQWLTKIPASGLIEVDLVGAGCLLIRRDVLEKCPPQRPEAGRHWFDWRVDMKGLLPDGECLSEDFTLNVHLKRTLGIPSLVDCSIRCRHVGLAQADYGTFMPCDTTPNT